MKPFDSVIRLVAWEVTRRCNLSCVHCRACAEDVFYENELSHDEGINLLNQIREVGSPIIILTGGEPMLRDDVYELAAHGTEIGLRMVMAPNGTLIDEEAVKKMLASGIKRISVSIDGPDAPTHDAIRKVPGAFERSMSGLETAKKNGLEFQINTTITIDNYHLIDQIHDMVISIGAAAHHIFLIVPTGRAQLMEGREITGQQYEDILAHLHEISKKSPIQIKPTCAPHYMRIAKQQGGAPPPAHPGGHPGGGHPGGHPGGMASMTRGCLGGTGFCFISHVGIVSPCGYLEIDAGNVREKTFKQIWEDSPVFNRMRNPDELTGKCGCCEFVRVCGGCRARAYAETGEYMAEEPNCVYIPKKGLKA